MELSINDIRELIGAEVPPTTPKSPLAPLPGSRLLIRTVTMTLTGEVVTADNHWIVLDTAAWIADTGRFSDAISQGTAKLNEVEPMGDGVRVAVGAIVDVTPWKHELPTTQK